MATQLKNTPVDTLRGRGGVKATIWKNDSAKGHFYSVEVSRTYKTDEGYRDSRGFSDLDLLVLNQLLPKAYDRVSELRRQDAAECDAAEAENAQPSEAA